MSDRVTASLALAIAAGACAILLPMDRGLAQQKQGASECEPGFEQRAYPHGSEQNFRCRTRVIDCPEKRGYHAAVIPDQVYEIAGGVQFGYRCQYTSRER